MAESNLNIALHTPVEELTDEQKQLIKDNVAALSADEHAKYVEAGIIKDEDAGEEGADEGAEEGKE